ncbi:MAG: hypothetical protein GEV05_26035 [Betaproteobacteria bacterium]|nr:hypothetical protein [Betaproteobacteria bacterium]
MAYAERDCRTNRKWEGVHWDQRRRLSVVRVLGGFHYVLLAIREGVSSMALRFEPIRPEFGARVSGVTLNLGMSDPAFSELRRALDKYSVLVFANQPMSDVQQIDFSRTTISNPAVLETPAYRQIETRRSV